MTLLVLGGRKNLATSLSGFQNSWMQTILPMMKNPATSTMA